MSVVDIFQPLNLVPSVSIAPEVLFDPAAGYIQATPGSTSFVIAFTPASALSGWSMTFAAATTFQTNDAGLPTGTVAGVQVRDPNGVLVLSIGDIAALELSMADLIADASRILTGDDTITGSDAADDLHGMSGDDVISGGLGDDRAWGGDGRDTFRGGRGADAFDGGAGNDVAYGNEDADALQGEGGDDFLYGGGGDDVIGGGDGHDVATGGVGADVIVGGAGEDLLFGNADADRLEGGDAFDRLFGEAGDDVLLGGGGGDEIRGGNGADFIDGGAGDDDLFGNAMADVIEGGGGVDRLAGGAGADRFVFAGRTPGVGDSVLGSGFNNGSADTIFDFGGSGAPVGERDSLDFNVAGTASNYIEEQTLIGDPGDGFRDAQVLANEIFRASPDAVYVAVEYMAAAGTSGGAGGVVIFLDTDGDNQVDQQVTLVGVSLSTIDHTFIV